jgi:hypothetical protein
LSICPSQIPDLGSRILDPKTATKERGENFVVLSFFSHKNHKTGNYVNFELAKKKIWANLQRIIELSIKKIVIKLSKIWVWDPRSGIRKKTYFGSRGQKCTRSRIPDLHPQH